MAKKSRVIAITGASAGVGRATVRAFAREKAKIALIARGKDGLDAAKREVEEMGAEALVFPADVSDYNRMKEVVAETERQFGPIDVWVNNAMVSVFSPVKDMRPEEYKRVTEVTYLGYVYCTLEVLKKMLPRNRGTIIQVGSALAYRSIPLQSAYCAAKHAIYGFTESLRTELIHDQSNVKVVMMELPAVNTPQFSWVKSRLPNQPQPVPPIFQPEVIADAIVYASYHPDQREYHIGYPPIEAALAEKFAANYADHRLAKTGYLSQQTDEPAAKNRRHNLWEPVPGDHGAHGVFDDRAHSFSAEFWARKNWKKLALGGLGLTFFSGFLRRARH